MQRYVRRQPLDVWVEAQVVNTLPDIVLLNTRHIFFFCVSVMISVKIYCLCSAYYDIAMVVAFIWMISLEGLVMLNPMSLYACTL